MAHLTNDLTEEEVAEFQDIFNLVDADNSGEISREELGELIATLGLKVVSLDYHPRLPCVDRRCDRR